MAARGVSGIYRALASVHYFSTASTPSSEKPLPGVRLVEGQRKKQQ